MMQSFALLLVAIFGLFMPVLIQHKADVQKKLATSCVEQPRVTTAANAANQAKATTQKSPTEPCDGGTGAAKTARAPSPAPSTTGVATALETHSRTAAVETRRMHHTHAHHARTRLKHETAANPAAAADRDAGF